MNTWTPVDNSGSNLDIGVTAANYEQNGDEVLIELNLTYPTNTDNAVAKVSLPTSQVANTMEALSVGYNSSSNPIYAQALNGNVKFYAGLGSTTALKNSDLSNVSINISGTYFSA